MAVAGIDHVNIRTADLPATVRFLADILDLSPGPMPGASAAEGIWMVDADGHAIVHVNAAAPAQEAARSESTGALHHVAFRCTGRDFMADRLDRLGLPYMANEVPAVGVRQLFVTDPNGILLELNFREPVGQDMP